MRTNRNEYEQENHHHHPARPRRNGRAGAIVAMTGQAQTIKASYEDILDSLPTVMQEYMAMQGVQHLCVTLRSVFNGKRAKMKKVSCDNGMFTEHNLLPDEMHLVFTDSIERLDFMALPLGSDSLRIACFYPDGSNRRLFEDTVKIDRMKILLETLTPGNGPDYPMIAYSAGIPVNGGTWYCGLRDAETEPRLWYEKHGTTFIIPLHSKKILLTMRTQISISRFPRKKALQFINK